MLPRNRLLSLVVLACALLGATDPETWTTSRDAPIGVPVATEDAMLPGFYALTVRADGLEEWRDTVVLEPCLETERAIVLRPAQQEK